jgi:hypothetical protein
VHSASTIFTADFGFSVGGEPAAFDDVLPNLALSDRIAIVTCTPGGALAAAPLLLAAVGRYYELWRERRQSFYRYPDYFVIHVGGRHGMHGWLDVWPEHKEVVVAPHGEAVLEALVDRGITRVVLEDAGAAGGEFMRENANWFLEDVRDVLTFRAERPAPSGCDVQVHPSAAAADMTVRAAEASRGLLPDDDIARIIRDAGLPCGFDRLSRAAGLERLAAYGPTPGVLGQSDDYLRRHGAGAEAMAHHRFTV